MHQNKGLRNTLYLKNLKKECNKSQAAEGRKQEIIEIIEVKKRKAIGKKKKTNEVQSWFLTQFKKTDKSVARLTKRGKKY